MRMATRLRISFLVLTSLVFGWCVFLYGDFLPFSSLLSEMKSSEPDTLVYYTYHGVKPSSDTDSPQKESDWRLADGRNAGAVPDPVRILREYIVWHSNDTLGKEGIYRDDRKYIVVAYNCPHQAGNGMTLFLNSFLLAVLTNRTLLWQSDGRPLDECNRVLHRAEWIPQADEHRLPKIHRLIVKKEQARACQKLFNVTKRDECIDRLKANPHRAEELITRNKGFTDHRAFRLQYLTGCWHSDTNGYWARFNLSDASCYNYVTALFPNDIMDPTRIQQLFQFGSYFLYGMLFDFSFSLTDQFMASVEQAQKLVDASAYTVAIHSRHIKNDDDGTDIAKELTALDHFFVNATRSKNCQLLIMSDRPATIKALYDYAEKHECEGVALHSSTSSTEQRRRHLILDQSEEHGPFAGAGFYQDLEFVSLARDGLVGSDRSSTALVLERTVYKNIQRTWNNSATRVSLSCNSGEYCYFLPGGSYKCAKWLI